MKDLEDLKLYGIRNRQKYLESSDWLDNRFSEGGAALEQSISDKRQLARDEISLIRDSLDYDEIKHLTIEF